MSGPLPFWDIMNIIGTQYPEAVAILQQPGVFQVYVDYLNSQNGVGEPWTPAQFQAKLRATPYYQNTPKEARDWDILRATDPMTTNVKAEKVANQLKDLQAQTGVTLDAATSFQFYVDAVRYNWDENEIKYRLLASVNTHRGAGLGSGEVGKVATDIKNMADQYAVPLSDQWIIAYATRVTQNAMTMDGVQGYLLEQARSMYPGLKAALDDGQTVRQYAEPYVQLAQQELDINPNDVRFTDPKWMAALNQVDPKTGQRTSMALDSWLQKLRTDPTYGYDTTAKGRQDATTLATQLSQKFGASA